MKLVSNGNVDYETYFYTNEDDYFNPFLWNEPQWHCRESMIYIDSESGSESVNPSGRAIKSDAYSGGMSREIGCIVNAHSRYYDSYFEMFEDAGSIQINVKGDIEICCYCKSGTVGSIFDYSSVEQIASEVKKFRQKMHNKDVANKTNMFETCEACRKMKLSKSAKVARV
jgi:hypothetical protein